MPDNVSIKIGVNSSAVATGLNAIRGQLAEFKSFAVSSFAQAFGAASIVAGIGSIISKAGALNDLAERFGVLPDELQRIGNVASQNGSSLESLGGAINKLALSQEKARTASAEHRAALDDLKISTDEFINLTPEEAFYRVADAVSKAEDRGKAYGAVIALMGKNAGELFTTLELGRQKIRELGDAMGVNSVETTRGLDNVGDALADSATASRPPSRRSSSSWSKLGRRCFKS